MKNLSILLSFCIFVQASIGYSANEEQPSPPIARLVAAQKEWSALIAPARRVPDYFYIVYPGECPADSLQEDERLSLQEPDTHRYFSVSLKEARRLAEEIARLKFEVPEACKRAAEEMVNSLPPEERENGPIPNDVATRIRGVDWDTATDYYPGYCRLERDAIIKAREKAVRNFKWYELPPDVSSR